jgi:Activator of Hsp90 ATPase homolog 1-like protein
MNKKKDLQMAKLKFSIIINAPKEKVWNTMLEDRTYRIWTEVFSEGSYYSGDWNKGSKILFLGPGNDGKTGGMVSRIKDNKLYEFISIEHLGEVIDGVEDTTSDRVKEWSGALENYTFIDMNGKTELIVEMDINEDFKEMFQNTWPQALQKLKELCEN